MEEKNQEHGLTTEEVKAQIAEVIANAKENREKVRLASKSGKCDFCPSEPTDCKKIILADGSHICVKDMSKQPSKAQ